MLALVASGWDLWVSLEPDGQQVPALSLAFANPKVTGICPADPAPAGLCRFPRSAGAGLGVPRGWHCWVPPRDGDSDVKARFSFFLFFFPFLMMIIFTVT